MVTIVQSMVMLYVVYNSIDNNTILSLQLIRDLKDEISKLRGFIRAEGLEGKVSALGESMYMELVNMYVHLEW